MNNRFNVISAFLTGLATGAIAGILIAPGNGSYTRNNLTSLLKKVTNRIYNFGADQFDSVRFSWYNRPVEVPDDLEHG